MAYGRSRRSGSGRRATSRRAGRRRRRSWSARISASRKPPLRTGMPRARRPGARPAARPARVPPVPQATAATSTPPRPRSSSPSAVQPTYGEGVAAALRDRRTRPRRPPRAGGRASVSRLGLAAVRRSVDEVQSHAVGRAAGQGRVEGAVGEFLAADHADGGQAEEAAGGGGGPQVVGVGAAEGEDRAARRRGRRFGASLRHLLPTRSGWIRSSRLSSSRTPCRANRSSTASCSGDGSRGRRVPGRALRGSSGLVTPPLSDLRPNGQGPAARARHEGATSGVPGCDPAWPPS